MNAALIDLGWEAAQLAFRAIMAARSDRDRQAIIHQLRSWGPAQRADVDRVEAERLAELSSMLPPVDPDLDAAITRRLRALDGDPPVTPVGGPLGPLDEGD